MLERRQALGRSNTRLACPHALPAHPPAAQRGACGLRTSPPHLAGLLPARGPGTGAQSDWPLSRAHSRDRPARTGSVTAGTATLTPQPARRVPALFQVLPPAARPAGRRQLRAGLRSAVRAAPLLQGGLRCAHLPARGGCLPRRMLRAVQSRRLSQPSAPGRGDNQSINLPGRPFPSTAEEEERARPAFLLLPAMRTVLPGRPECVGGAPVAGAEPPNAALNVRAAHTADGVTLHVRSIKGGPRAADDNPTPPQVPQGQHSVPETHHRPVP